SAFDAQRVECNPPVLIELKQRSISSICRRIRVKSDDILLRNARYLFNRNIFPGKLSGNGGCKDVGVPRIRLRVHPGHAMALFRNTCQRRDKQTKPERAESLHAD